MKHRTRLISAFVYIILALLGTVATGQGPNGPKDTVVLRYAPCR
jgi:hypothetical protein